MKLFERLYKEMSAEEKEAMAKVKSLAVELYQEIDRLELKGGEEIKAAKDHVVEAVMWVARHIIK